MPKDTFWYKNAIFYAIDVHRFQDGNGDGHGDFMGLKERLDYLSDLGVTCLWLLPFFPSPYRDNGYDVSNYMGIDPRVGTFDDFLEFLHAAGEHGMRVIIDLVVDHTSDRHPWFIAARHDPASRFRNYYTWSDHPDPVPPDSGNIFPGEEDTVWTYDEIAGSYYYHRFYHFEPDLNATIPEVHDEICKIMEFWLSFGIAGFRIDATAHMLDAEGQDEEWTGDPHQLLKNMRSHADSRGSGAVLLGEVDEDPEKLSRYFGDDDELNMMFNFLLNNYMFLALARQQGSVIARALKQLPAVPPSGQWCNFIRNMDELDLERLTQPEREDVLAAFAPEEDMQIFGRGIRRRIAPMLNGDRRRLELVFSLLLSLPGAPLIIYGDEIGMGEDLSRPGREPVRAPMQWSSGRNAGFSDADEGDLIQPLISEGAFAYENVNVGDQLEQTDSFLSWLRGVIFTRRATPTFGFGTWRTFDLDVDAVLAHRCTWKDEIVVALHNFSDEEQHVELDLQDQTGRSVQNLLDNRPSEPIRSGSFAVDLEPFGYRWFRVAGDRPS